MTNSKNYVKKQQQLAKKNNGKHAKRAEKESICSRKSKRGDRSFMEKRLGTKVKDWEKSSILKKRLQDTIARAVEPGMAQEIDMDAHPSDKFEINKAENSNREAENTKRQFRRELSKVLAAADVVIQVLDARDPMNCRNRALEREIQGDPTKKMILLLNKVDLIPKNLIAVWQKVLQRDFPCLAFKCSTQQGGLGGAQGGSRLPQGVKLFEDTTESKLLGGKGSGNDSSSSSSSSSKAMEGEEAMDGDENEAGENKAITDSNASKVIGASNLVLGADNLVQLLKNYARTAAGSKKAIAVGVIGFPNVGKSSVINALKRSNVVRVGGTAGVTRAMQEVVLDSKLRLIDCPGVVFSGSSEDPSVVLRNAVKVEHLRDPVTVVEKLTTMLSLKRLVAHFLAEKMNNNEAALEKINDGTEFLHAFAKVRGLMKRGGVFDVVRAAVHVLQDIASGKFPYHVLPDPSLPENRVLLKNCGDIGEESCVVASSEGLSARRLGGLAGSQTGATDAMESMSIGGEDDLGDVLMGGEGTSSAAGSSSASSSAAGSADATKSAIITTGFSKAFDLDGLDEVKVLNQKNAENIDGSGNPIDDVDMEE